MSAPSFNMNRGATAILAPTVTIARHLAQELNITKPVLLGRQSHHPARGTHLSVLLVDSQCWPLPEKVRHEIMPALHKHKGYMMVINRFDPWARR